MCEGRRKLFGGRFKLFSEGVICLEVVISSVETGVIILEGGVSCVKESESSV